MFKVLFIAFVLFISNSFAGEDFDMDGRIVPDFSIKVPTKGDSISFVRNVEIKKIAMNENTIKTRESVKVESPKFQIGGVWDINGEVKRMYLE